METNGTGGGSIRVTGARQNNLKNIDVQIPLHQLTVVTGGQRVGQVEPGFRYLVR